MSGLKIISGGQTGVDRAALDAALALGVPCGGWCPDGRLDETGQIPAHYPVTELPSGGFCERTRQNVKDSDGTLVLCFGEPHGGTKATVSACDEYGKPCQILDAMQLREDECTELAVRFVREHRIQTLNIAGPRASEEPAAYAFAFDVLMRLLQRFRDAKTD